MFTTFYYTFTILSLKICFENIVALLIIHSIDIYNIYRGKNYALILYLNLKDIFLAPPLSHMH